MTSEALAHLLIVDGDERLRDLLRQYLKGQGFLLSASRDEAHARRLLAGLEFDLIVLDARLPDAEALRNSVATPTLLLLGKGDVAPEGCEAIEKPFEPKALLGQINAILDRRPQPVQLAPKVVHFGELRFDTERGALLRGSDSVKLTATELQLMRILCDHVGEPVGRGELVARLGRTGLATKARAVDVQIARLRRKLEANSRSPKHLQTVRGAGYMLVSD